MRMLPTLKMGLPLFVKGGQMGPAALDPLKIAGAEAMQAAQRTPQLLAAEGAA